MKMGCIEVKRYLLTMLMIMMLLTGTWSYVGAEEPMTILLLGTDSLGYELVTGDEEMSRADAIYVLNLYPATGTIKLLSVERDYLVTLPGDLGENKLATATYFGGPEMAMDAVNELLLLNVDLYAQVDLVQLIAAVDAIGGLSVEVLESEVADVNVFISAIRGTTDLKPVHAGINHLNGHELWAFIGHRDTIGDAIAANQERNDRQMRAVRAGLQRLNEMGLGAAVEVADDLLSFVKTNLTMSDILTAVQAVQGSAPDAFAYLRTPSTPYTKKRAGVHQVIVANDMQEEISVVAGFLSN